MFLLTLNQPSILCAGSSHSSAMENFVGRKSQLSHLEDGLFVDGRFSKMALYAFGEWVRL
jgi:hypothetical protein